METFNEKSNERNDSTKKTPSFSSVLHLKQFKKYFCGGILFVITVAALLLVAHLSHSFNDDVSTTETSNLKNICLSSGCIREAHIMMSRMNSRVDPCDDFYEYSCGNFIKNNIIPDGETVVSTFSLMKHSMMRKLRILLQRHVDNSDPYYVNSAKTFYASCMDRDAIEKTGLSAIKSAIDDLGGWPVVEGPSWKPKGHWKSIIYNSRLRGLNINTLFTMKSEADSKNATRNILKFDQPSLGLEREYLLQGFDNDIVKAYLHYATKVAKLFGADPLTSAEEMKEMLDFETSLARASLSREERRNDSKLYNPMELIRMNDLLPKIPWMEFIKIILPAKLQVNETEIIDVMVPTYFKKLSNLLEKESNRTVANYLIWRIVLSTEPYLNNAMRNLGLEYAGKKEGKTSQLPRWEECAKLVTKRMDFAVGQLYVKEYFNKESKRQVEEMVDYIYNEFLYNLKKMSWMDDVTKQEALDKAKAMVNHTAYPEELLNDNVLNEFYKDLIIRNESLLENISSHNEFKTTYDLGGLRDTVNRSHWTKSGSVAVVNAFYSNSHNSIELPAGILQGQMFEPDRPNYMNFAGIGIVIGHEIIHGFDDRGKSYDSQGNLRNWWRQNTELKFRANAQCIIWHYGNYSENGVHLNGVVSQGENIADNGGTTQAYGAYQRWAQERAPEPTLAGMNHLAPNQLFWISAAQKQCSKESPEELKKWLLTYTHSPWKFRTLGVYRNSLAFSKDWNCPVSSKMNPKRKCKVW